MKKYLLVLCTLLLLNVEFCRAQYTDTYDFDDLISTSSLALYGNTFYTTSVSGQGAIYSVKADGTGYKALFNFNGKNGSRPVSYLTPSITGDTLFGMTSAGGKDYNQMQRTMGYGCIYCIRKDGSGFTKLLDFDGHNGKNPAGSLSLIGNTLYGMTYFGGKYDKGCVFSIKIDGTDYNDLLDFDGTNGEYPNGSLTLSLTGDTLFGMTLAGGTDKSGCIFSLKTNGTGYQDLFDFSAANSNGGRPSGNLILSSRVLYGMTWGSGMNQGCVFSINANGTGYKDLMNFNGANGAFPYGSLTIVSGVLYGMTTAGGANNQGVLFSINRDGTGYSDLFDFHYDSSGCGAHGTCIPYNGFLYGIVTKPTEIGSLMSYKIN